MPVRLRLLVLALALVPRAAQAVSTIDFEGLSEGAVVASVSSGAGISGDVVPGSVQIFGQSKNPAITTNAAILFDAECDGSASNCTGEDPDLFFPGLGKVLIIAEDLVDADMDGLVDDPDDADRTGQNFTFDFSGFGPAGTVTVESLVVLDAEGDEASGMIELFAGGPGGTLLASLPIPVTGDNGAATLTIGVSGVDFMRVTQAGSGAFDNVRITAAPAPTPTPTVTPTQPPDPTSTPTPLPLLNHFQCYEVHRGKLNATVTLDDAFGPGDEVQVIRAKRLCSPADKDGEDPGAILDPDHFTKYQIRQRSPRFAKIKDQVVVNQFGTFLVDLLRPDFLLVPTAKSLTMPVAPLANPAIDHFKCYKVRAKQRFMREALPVEDQFVSQLLDVKKPRRLCAAADKNDEGVMRPDDHLLCFQVRTARGAVPFRGTSGAAVFTNNQFGPDNFDLFRPTEFCVPSQLNP